MWLPECSADCKLTVEAFRLSSDYLHEAEEISFYFSVSLRDTTSIKINNFMYRIWRITAEQRVCREIAVL